MLAMMSLIRARCWIKSKLSNKIGKRPINAKKEESSWRGKKRCNSSRWVDSQRAILCMAVQEIIGIRIFLRIRRTSTPPGASYTKMELSKWRSFNAEIKSACNSYCKIKRRTFYASWKGPRWLRSRWLRRSWWARRLPLWIYQRTWTMRKMNKILKRLSIMAKWLTPKQT